MTHDSWPSDSESWYIIYSMTTRWSAYINQREPAYSMTQTGCKLYMLGWISPGSGRWSLSQVRREAPRGVRSGEGRRSSSQCPRKIFKKSMLKSRRRVFSAILQAEMIWSAMLASRSVANFREMKFGTPRSRRRRGGYGEGYPSPQPTRQSAWGASWAPPAGSGLNPGRKWISGIIKLQMVMTGRFFLYSVYIDLLSEYN